MDFNRKEWITYIGSKRKLLDAILTKVQSITTQGRILDLFSGSGVVSGYLKYHGYEVHANDVSSYSHVVNSVLLGIDEKTCPGAKNYIDHLNSFSAPKKEYFFSKYYSENGDVNRERLFYTSRNGLFIDAVLEQIWHLDNSELRNIILSDLLVKMSRHANTNGVFKACHKKFGGSKSDALNRILAPIHIEMPKWIKGPTGKSFQYDALTFLKTTPFTYDVVYLDPPYNQHQYSANYHLLEYACQPFNKRYVPTDDQISGIDPNLYKSPYCSKTKCFDELKSIISICTTKSPCIILSYNENGHVSKNDLISFLSTLGDVDCENISVTNFRGGRHRSLSKNNIDEYIFILKIHR